jgi:asparagine N-glycosylation enzyme membrane subunit Stt3
VSKIHRHALLLFAAILGLATSAVSAVSLVPRVRLVDVVLVFATAVGGGAALAIAIVGFREARASATRPPAARSGGSTSTTAS